MSTDAVPALLRRLVDDAALFPPGNAPMPVALAEHHHHLLAPYADLVGPFLLPASRWEEFTASSAGGIELGLVGDADRLIEAARLAAADERIRLVQLECPAGGSATATATRIRDEVGDGPDLFIEIPRTPGWLDAVAALEGAWPKLRTGGLTADAFPSEADLTAFIGTCLRLERPFKLTAGLHRAVRHTDPRTGFEHHGYLNVLAAVSGPTGVAEAIAGRDPAPLVAAVRAGGSRTWFRSYGSCSIAEPLDDLAALGLLDPALADHLPAPREEHA